ncbi:MAG TPA: hypothetical protein VMA31_04450 [Bryobacteraceae bacterium]|nr:hypothetical protein [Bryobacteraceae bacterium]
MPAILTTDNLIQCPHGGVATVAEPSNNVLFVEGSPALLETDAFVIEGCTFNILGVPLPCVSILWTDAADMLTVDDAGVLLETSIGYCLNEAGAPQAIARVGDSTPEVDAV